MDIEKKEREIWNLQPVQAFYDIVPAVSIIDLHSQVQAPFSVLFSTDLGRFIGL